MKRLFLGEEASVWVRFFYSGGYASLLRELKEQALVGIALLVVVPVAGVVGEVVAVAVAVAAVVVVEVRLFPLLCLEQPWHGHENHTDCLLAICLCLPLMGDDASSGLESSGEVVL